MIRWTGLAPWEFEFPIPGSLASTFLALRPPSGRLGDRDLQKGAAREFVIDNLLVRNHFIIVMIRWTGLLIRWTGLEWGNRAWEPLDAAS